MAERKSLGVKCALVACFVFSLSAVSNAVDQDVLDAQAKRVAVVEEIAPSVVAVFSKGGKGGGSGVLISPDGYALTNYHVTSGAGDFMKCGLNDGKLYDAVIVGIDPTGDVALIQLLGRDDFPHCQLGDSDTVKVGDWAYAMGNPFLLATDFHPTVTYGIVSGVNRYQYPAGTFLEYSDCIQIDTSINPGNSGGPLFNDSGELIGINGRGSFEKRGRVNSGAGYAISINQIKHFMDHLKSGRIVDHATLGATVATSETGAVVVTNVLDSSEAHRRGLRIDDEIVSFAGRPIGSVNQYKNILGIYPKGWRIPLVYRRDQQKKTIHVRLAALHRQSELTATDKPKGPMPIPKPKEPKPGDQDDKDKGDKKDKPKPDIHKMLAGAAAPAKYKHMLVKKPGFSNYYFNEQNQKRLVKQLTLQFGASTKWQGQWNLKTKSVQGVPVDIMAHDTASLLRLPTDDFLMVIEEPLTHANPIGSGGMLVAMHQLRMLVTKQDKYFTEFYYLGSEPLDGKGETVDVLITLRSGIECRWYFSKKSGRFVGFDSRLSPYEDDCRIRFAEFDKFEDRSFPKGFTVSHAEFEFADLEVSGIEIKDTTETP